MNDVAHPVIRRLRLHGPGVAVELADGRAIALERKEAALLAFLAIEGPAARARLAGLLWGDSDESRARASLRQRLSRLRRSAGDVVCDGSDGTLRLAAGIATDLEDASVGELLGALAYDDCDEFARWLDLQRDSLRAQRRARLLADARQAAQCGELDRALSLADALVRVDRESEEAYRLLMEVFYLRGDRAAAIAAWDRCREMLRTVYGVKPMAETDQLGRTILAVVEHTPAPVSSVSIPLSVLRPPRLIGRAGVLRAMRQAWAAGDTLVVAGEAGIGKSRLLAEFQADVGPSVGVSARPGDAVVSYASLARLLRAAWTQFQPALDHATLDDCARLLPELRPGRAIAPIQSEGERLRFLHALATLLDACARAGCAAVVFDDLQFVDAASCDALRVIVEPAAADTGGARFVFATRVEDLTPQASAVLDALEATRRVARFELAPLSVGDSAQLLASLEIPGLDSGDIAARLRSQVGGNPAFLLETVKTLLTEQRMHAGAGEPLAVAPSLAAMVGRRLARLSPDALNLAQLAAVAGSDFSAELAAHAMGRAPLALAPLLRELDTMQILRANQFVHDLVAEAVRRTVPAPIESYLHRAVAEFLQRLNGEPASIAAHLLAGKDEAAAAPFLHDAGRRARDRWQLDEAVRLLRRAFDTLRAANRQDGALEAALELADVQIGVSANAEAAEALAAARALVRSPRDHVRVMSQMARLCSMRLLGREEERLAAELWEFIRGHADELQADDLAGAVVAVARGLLRDAGQARAFIEFVAARLDASHSGQQLRWLNAAGWAELIAGDMDRARSHWREMAALARRCGDPVRERHALRGLAFVAVDAGEHDESVRCLEAGERLMRACGFGRTMLHEMVVRRAPALNAQGRYDESLALLLPLHEDPQLRGENSMIETQLHLASTYAVLGQPDLAQQALDSHRPWHGDWSEWHMLWHGFQARLSALLGRDCREQYAAASRMWWSESDHVAALRFRLWRAADAGCGDPVGDLERIAQVAHARHLRATEREAQVALARFALQAGRKVQAATHARAALALIDCAEQFFAYLPDAWWIGYQAFAANDEAGDADECMRRASDWVDRVAREHVPQAHRARFLARNATNRALREAARKLEFKS